MICPKCGTNNDSEYIFCVNCGTSIPGTPRLTPDYSTAPSGEPSGDLQSVQTAFLPSQSAPPTQQVDPLPPQKKGRGLMFGGLALLLLIVAGGAIGGYFYLSREAATAETLPDHLGMFFLDKDKTSVSEIKKVDVTDVAESKDGMFSDTSMPKMDYTPEIILYAEGNDVPLGDLKFVQLDSINADGTMKQIEFQAVPVDGKRAMKRLKFPNGLAAGKYAFAIFNGFLDEGKHRLWPFRIDRSDKQNNADIQKDLSVPLKTKSANTNSTPAPAANTAPVPKPTVSAPVGSTVAFCNSTDVIVRASPSLEAKKLNMLKKGQRVFVMRYSENTDMWKGVESNWAYIQTETGKTGWVFTPFITK